MATGCTISVNFDYDYIHAPRYDASLNRPVRVTWVFSSGRLVGFILPTALLMVEMFFTSIYFTFKDSFITENKA